MSCNPKITLRDLCLNAKTVFKAILSHNVNLQTNLYPQQIYKLQNRSKDCEIKRQTEWRELGVVFGLSTPYLSLENVIKIALGKH